MRYTRFIMIFVHRLNMFNTMLKVSSDFMFVYDYAKKTNKMIGKYSLLLFSSKTN